MHSIAKAFTTPPSRWLDVGHSRLAYRCFGSGPDLVFVHGWPLTSATWRDVVRELAPHYTCHLIDLPGTGHTRTGDDAPFGVQAHAQTLRRAVDELGLRRLSLVGHDSGGAIARYLAASLGDRVRALVLSGTEIPHYRSLLLYSFELANRMPAWAWRRVLNMRWLLRSRLLFGSCFADPDYAEGEFGRLMIEPLRHPGAMEQQLRMLRSIELSDFDGLEKIHAQLTAPTLLIWGSDDGFFPIHEARAMVGQFAGPARLVEITGGRTFVHDEMPERFAALAREHLETHLGSVTLAETGS